MTRTRFHLNARRAVGVLMLAGTVVSCTQAESRSDVLRELAETVITPNYDMLATATQDLADATSELCTDPTPARLESTLATLDIARQNWSRSEAMWAGPVMDRRSWAAIDWPIQPHEIEELIDDTSIDLTLERLGKGIGADQRGLSAIEYVLAKDTPSITISMLSDQRRCQYLSGIAAVVHTEAALLPNDWMISFENGDPYTDTFAAPDTAAVDSLVNDALFLLEDIGDRELGQALGAMEGDADPTAINEGPANHGVSDITNHLHGLRQVFIGDAETSGLQALLGEELSDRLVSQIDRSIQSAEAIDGSLRVAVTNQPDQVNLLRDNIKTLQVTVATEVVARLGVTIGFSDADGDTGA